MKRHLSGSAALGVVLAYALVSAPQAIAQVTQEFTDAWVLLKGDWDQVDWSY